jgi:hypothetical protein
MQRKSRSNSTNIHGTGILIAYSFPPWKANRFSIFNYQNWTWHCGDTYLSSIDVAAAVVVDAADDAVVMFVCLWVSLAAIFEFWVF